jgi:hypothetical protein
MPMPTLTRFSPRLSEVPVVEGIAQAGVNFFIDGQRAVAVGALEFTPVPVKVEYPWRPYYVIYISFSILSSFPLSIQPSKNWFKIIFNYNLFLAIF